MKIRETAAVACTPSSASMRPSALNIFQLKVCGAVEILFAGLGCTTSGDQLQHHLVVGLLRANESRKYLAIPSRLISEFVPVPPLRLRPIRILLQMVDQ